MKTASDFLKADLSLTDREPAILDMFQRGCVPSWSTVRCTVSWMEGGVKVSAGVAPDYLMIGDDNDFLRIPMQCTTAQKVCDLYGAGMPTRHIVNRIFEQANHQLVGNPFPTTHMRDLSTFKASHDHIERQIDAIGATSRLETFAGHKKDIVVSNLLAKHPGHVVIYGFCESLTDAHTYRFWQPLYAAHTSDWTDYSQCPRMVYDVNVDGTKYGYAEALQNPSVAHFFSDEGVIATPRYS